MGVRFVAPGCKSGYDSNKGEKYHFFIVPKDPVLIQKWQKAILRDDIILRHKHAVCEKHFHPSYIIWGSEVKGSDGSVMSSIRYKIPKLRKGALPQKFPNCPKYLSTNKAEKRKSPKKRQIPDLADPNVLGSSGIKKPNDVQNIPLSDEFEIPEMLEEKKSPKQTQDIPELKNEMLYIRDQEKWNAARKKLARLSSN